jgi:ankyrin repeat protein
MTNSKGDTILHQACSKGYTQIASYLLTLGADINASNNDG